MSGPVREGVLYFDLRIDGIDDEGRGRALVEDWDIAVRGAYPGDVVSCRIERAFPARTLAQARALAVVAGPVHLERACPHPSPCAGCPLADADEAFAAQLKRGRVLAALEEAGVRVDPALVADVEAARAPRQKVKLTAGGRAGALALGMFVPHTHVLEDAAHCRYQNPQINDALERVMRVLNDADTAPATVDPRGIKAVIARAFVEGVGIVVVDGGALSDESTAHARTWAALAALVGTGPVASMALRTDTRAGNSIVGGDVARRAGPTALTPLEGGAPASVDAFCQSDPELAAHMYQRAAAFLVAGLEAGGGGRSLASARFLDAYAGAGGFSRALIAAGARDIVAVERAPEGAAALKNLAVTARECSVEDALPSLAAMGPWDGVIVDPPKSGLRDAAGPLADLRARRVVLVACDPDAGARDARAFLERGYRLDAVEPVDLFPGTPEVETVFFFTHA